MNEVIGGNPARREGGWKKHLEKLGRRVEAISNYIDKQYDEGRRIDTIRFKVRYPTHGDILVVITADHDGASEVAFSSGPDFEDALNSLGGALSNGNLHWREDEYGKPKSSHGAGDRGSEEGEDGVPTPS